MTITARVAQAARIWTAVARYRAAIQKEAAARAVREEQAERERQQQAQREFEDDLARALAEGNVHFPSDERGGTVPGLLSLEEWRRLHIENVWERR